MEAAIRSVRGVDELVVTSAERESVRAVVSTRSSDLREELSRAVIDAGFGLLEVQARTLTLEDVFLQLTRGEQSM